MTGLELATFTPCTDPWLGTPDLSKRNVLGGLDGSDWKKNAMGEGAMEKMICNVDAVGRWEEGGGEWGEAQASSTTGDPLGPVEPPSSQAHSTDI
jgi:hypothetical protein